MANGNKNNNKHSVYTSHSINLSPSYHSKPSWKDQLYSASYLLHNTVLPPLPFHWVFPPKDFLVDMFSWFFPVIPCYLVPQEYLSMLTTLSKLFVFSINGASLRTFLFSCYFPIYFLGSVFSYIFFNIIVLQAFFIEHFLSCITLFLRNSIYTHTCWYFELISRYKSSSQFPFSHPSQTHISGSYVP